MSIHVLVAGLPRLLSEMLSVGVHQPPDLVLAASTEEGVRPGSDALEKAILAHEPDAVVIGMNQDETNAVGVTQLRHPDMALVAVAPDGASAWNVVVSPEFLLLDPVSPSGIRQAIVDAVRRLDPNTNQNDPCRTGDVSPQPQEGT